MAGARDGQLRIRRGGDSPPWGLDLYDDGAALWRNVAYAPGVPVLRGPYVVNVGDIPTEGSTMPLWTPAAGDVLLRLFADWQSVIQWDQGGLFIGQGVVVNDFDFKNVIAAVQVGPPTQIGQNAPGLDNIIDDSALYHSDGSSSEVRSTATVFQSADPVQIQLARTGGTDPSAGHVELYALIARAVAP